MSDLQISLTVLLVVLAVAGLVTAGLILRWEARR